MKNERILSYTMAKKLSEEEINEVGSGGSTQATVRATCLPNSPDTVGDVTFDF